MAGCDFVVSVFMLLMFFASLVMLSLLSGLCSVWFIVCAFCGLHEGHFYMRTAPLLAPVSTVGKSRLVVVAVQGAPPFHSSCRMISETRFTVCHGTRCGTMHAPRIAMAAHADMDTEPATQPQKEFVVGPNPNARLVRGKSGAWMCSYHGQDS